MKKNIIKAIIAVSALSLLCSCGSREKESYETTTQGDVVTTQSETTLNYDFHTEEVYISAPETNITVQATQAVTLAELPTREEISQNTSTEAPTQNETEAPQEETTEKVYQKTGEMAFSDSADNKFIKAVADKYGVNAKTLAAIYTVPENNGNMVLEFNGTTDSNGKLIRNKDTLVAIYTVDKNLNSKRASEDNNLNEYSSIERKAIFFSTTTYIMPEFEAELNG